MTPPQRPALAAAARRGISWSGLSVGAGALLQLAQVALAARFLSREDFGLVALASVALALGSGAAELGTANAVLHRQRSSPAELSSLFWLNLATGLLLAAVVAAAAPLLGAAWLLWVAPPLLAAGLCQVHVALLRRELRFRALACIDLGAAAAGLLCVALLAPRGFGVVALLGAQALAACVRALLALLLGLRLLRPRLRLAPGDVEPFLRFGVYQLGERLVNVASWHLDRLVLAAALGTEVLGVYHLAYQLVIRPFWLMASFSRQVTLPLLARLQTDAEALRAAYLTVVRLVATAALPLYGGAFVLAGPLIGLVYGPGWTDVTALFRLLWPLGVFYALGNPVGALIVATGRVRLGFWWNVFAACVHLVAVLAGLAWGARGVAAALVLSTALVLFPAGFYLRWLLVRLRPAPYLAGLARPLLSTCAMGLVVHLLAGALAALPAALRVAVAVASGVLLYCAIVLPAERGLLAALRSS